MGSVRRCGRTAHSGRSPGHCPARPSATVTRSRRRWSSCRRCLTRRRHGDAMGTRSYVRHPRAVRAPAKTKRPPKAHSHTPPSSKPCGSLTPKEVDPKSVGFSQSKGISHIVSLCGRWTLQCFGTAVYGAQQLKCLSK